MNENKYTRICPQCNGTVYHSSVGSRWHCRYNVCRKCSYINRTRVNIREKNGMWKGVGEVTSTYFKGIVKHAMIRNRECSITMVDMWNQFLLQNKKCVYTGLPLTLPSRSRNKSDGNSSLDRIDSNKGYTIDNIQWVHKDINWMKQDFPHNYFKEMCNLVSANDNITPIDDFIKNNKNK